MMRVLAGGGSELGPDALSPEGRSEFAAFVEVPSVVKSGMSRGEVQVGAGTEEMSGGRILPSLRNDDEVWLAGSAEKGWELVCDGTAGHPEAYRLAAS